MAPTALYFTNDPAACKLLAQDPSALPVGFGEHQAQALQSAFAGPKPETELGGQRRPTDTTDRQRSHELLVQPCDIAVPAALERVIDADTAARLRCRVLAEGANGPPTPGAELVLNQRRTEVWAHPDIPCNARGGIVSYGEGEEELQLSQWSW